MHYLSLMVLMGLALAQPSNYIPFQTIINNNPYPAPLFLHSMSEAKKYMAILDTNLNITWHVNSGDLGIDFKVNQNNLSYFNRIGQSWILLNEFMVETDTLTCIGDYNADYHDIQITESGGFILQSYNTIYVDMSSIVEGGNITAQIQVLIIQEIDSNHSLIFEWNAWDHLDISDYTNFDLTSPTITWMHGNSIEIDYDENLLISNRMSSEIIKIDRNNGNVIWIFGGPMNQFSLSNDPKNGFKKQHDVRRLLNGNIMLFDNGNTHDPPVSRAVEYSLDEIGKIANLVWDYEHPEEYVGLAMGSVQRLPNNNTLINWGTISGQGAIITEVDYEKNIVLELEYPHPYNTYKVRKSNSYFETTLLPGDVNLDGVINILDINYCIDYILTGIVEPDMVHLFRYDINKDHFIDLIDIEILINQILY